MHGARPRPARPAGGAPRPAGTAVGERGTVAASGPLTLPPYRSSTGEIRPGPDGGRAPAASTDGETMSTATRTDSPAPARHAADSHDLIRVHGAREHNLADVSLEIPKRRLTVFTGVS